MTHTNDMTNRCDTAHRQQACMCDMTHSSTLLRTLKLVCSVDMTHTSDMAHTYAMTTHTHDMIHTSHMTHHDMIQMTHSCAL